MTLKHLTAEQARSTLMLPLCTVTSHIDKPCWRCWSLLRWKFSFHCGFTNVHTQWNAKPLSRSLSIVERNRDFRIFMALKHLSAEQEVNDNVALCAVTFWYWQTVLALSSICRPWTCKTIESIHHLLLFSPKVDKILFISLCNIIQQLLVQYFFMSLDKLTIESMNLFLKLSMYVNCSPLEQMSTRKPFVTSNYRICLSFLRVEDSQAQYCIFYLSILFICLWILTFLLHYST